MLIRPVLVGAAALVLFATAVALIYAQEPPPATPSPTVQPTPGRSAQVTPAPTVTATPSTDEAALLRELAERSLTGPGFAIPIRLLSGRVPLDIADLALPPGSRLVGSIVRGESIDVVLDTPGTPTDVVTFFENTLADRGWFPGFQRRLGFQPTTAPLNIVLCQSESGPWLSVTAAPRDIGPADVRIHREAGPGPCGVPGRDRGFPPGFDFLPPLYAPPGAQVSLTGGGPSGPGRASSEATAIAPTSVPELEAYFAAQLEGTGWTRVAGGADEPLAWSMWALPDPDWEGLLLVYAAAGENRRSLSLRVESPTAGRPGFPGPPPLAPPPPPGPPPVRPPPGR